MNRREFLLPLLAATVLLLGWKTYRAWSEPPGDGRLAAAARPVQASGASAGDAPPEADLSAAAVATIVGRPVFRPDRKPFRPEEAGTGVPARNYEAELSRYMLLGVVLQGDSRKAVVVGKGQVKPERWDLGIGDAIPGFTVKEVDPDGVTLAADGKEFLLPLYAGAPKAPVQGQIRTEGAPLRAPGPAAGPVQPRIMQGVAPSQQFVPPPGAAGQRPPPVNMQRR